MKHCWASVLAGGLILAGCSERTVTTENADGTTNTTTEIVPKRGAELPLREEGAQRAQTTGIITDEEVATGKAVQAQSGNGPGVPNDADAALAQRVRVAITTGSSGTTGRIAEKDLTPLQVTSKDGLVTISGNVRSVDEMNSIIKLIGPMQGVKGLDNQMKVGAIDPKQGQNTSVKGNADEAFNRADNGVKPRATE